MNNFKHILCAMTALALVTTSAIAESFNATNYLANGASITSWPTNTAGTNGLNRLTGGKISIANVSEAGFYFSGYSTTNTNSTVTITLVVSSKDAPPRAPDGTNQDWTLTAPISLTFATVGAGPQYWATNLNADALQNANWVGVRSAANNGAGSVLTNVDYGLNKKIRRVMLQ